ncbi:MAG TPA: nucleotide exchange factor GrpE [Vicinamibacterales bacterium]|nr:nucleotide exchange factor GrpE [Vicinamibacterales bacterium]
MSADEHDIPVKVVDRRWWAQPEGTRAAEGPTSLKPTYLEELEQQLAEKDRQIQEYLSKYRQASSEFEEARARMRKEIARDAERARREILVGFLEVVDNLERAIEAARQPGVSPDVVLQGIDLVRQQFLSRLQGLGVERITSERVPFDPQLHEAVSAVPVQDAALDGTIVGVVRQGYRIGDDVLRPALVAVAKAGEIAR